MPNLGSNLRKHQNAPTCPSSPACVRESGAVVRPRGALLHEYCAVAQRLFGAVAGFKEPQVVGLTEQLRGTGTPLVGSEMQR